MKRAIILSGGAGERLRPLTTDKPKAMVEVDGRPIMEYQIRWLTFYGIDEIVVACGYRHEVMQDFFGDGKDWKVQIEYLIESAPLGRGGALKRAITHIAKKEQFDLDQPILALNGDLLTNLPLDNFRAAFLRHKPLVLVATVPLISRFGIMELSGDSLVKKFTEKPKMPFWINAGIYALSPSVQKMLPDIGDHELTTLPQLAGKGQLRAYTDEFLWKNIENSNDLREAELDLESYLV